jgi:uncharacterized integral membrane protein (TIGR00698 family)
MDAADPRDGPSQIDRLASLDSMEGLVRAEPARPRSWLDAVPFGALIRTVYPGLLAAGTIGLAAAWLSQHYGAPVMLFALMIGMAFHFLHEQGRCVAGIEFASRTVLRLGVALLGARFTADQIASLGPWPVLTVIVGVATTVLIGLALARRFGLSPYFGLVSGGSVAICGASAALAVASVLPRTKQLERDTILTVVTVTAFSTAAMVLYPSLVPVLGFDAAHAGIFLGGTIHDVAQVVGAGGMVSPEARDVATYMKMLRVAMLVPLVVAIAVVLARLGTAPGAGRAPLVPAFLIGFVALVALNSLGAIPAFVGAAVTGVSNACLIAAIAALGMKTSFKDLTAAGWRPVGLIAVETLWIAALVLAAVYWLI